MAKKLTTERQLPIKYNPKYFEARYFNRHSNEFEFHTVQIVKDGDELFVLTTLRENDTIGNMRFVETIYINLKTAQDFRTFETLTFHVDPDEDFINNVTVALDAELENDATVTIEFRFRVKSSTLCHDIETECETMEESSHD